MIIMSLSEDIINILKVNKDKSTDETGSSADVGNKLIVGSDKKLYFNFFGINPPPIYLVYAVVKFIDGDSKDITLMSDFNTLCDSNNYIRINGQRILKNTIVSVVIQSDYKYNYLPDGFCNGMTALVDIGDIPNNITHIGSNFLSNCVSFNKDVVINGNIKIIESNFLSGCTNFDGNIIIQEGVTSIYNGFLKDCIIFNKLLVLPNSLKYIHGSFLEGCTSFKNSLTLPSNLFSIGDRFLYGCNIFNFMFYLPDSVNEIGNYFMSGCSQYNQNLTIPINTNKIGSAFLYNCDDYISTIIWNGSVPKLSETSFATTNSKVPMYTKGIFICGSNGPEVINKFPTTFQTPFRRLNACKTKDDGDKQL